MPTKRRTTRKRNPRKTVRVKGYTRKGKRVAGYTRKIKRAKKR